MRNRRTKPWKSKSAGKTRRRLRASLASLENELNALEKEQADAAEGFASALSEYTKEKTRAEEKSAALGRAKEEEAKAKESFARSLSEQGFSTWEEAQAMHLGKAQFEEREAAVKDYQAKRAETEGRLKGYRERGIDALEKADLAPLQTALEEARAQAKECMERYLKRRDDHAVSQSAYRKSSSAVSGFEKNMREASEARKMAKVFDGTVPGKSKLPFETYRMRPLFSNILRLASKKIYEMSDGVYTFLPSEIGGGKQAKAGLDIDVLDAYNGQRRDARTLSGGEKFEAALALALGFSEAIGLTAGGVEMNCMFIDEGFGSLDSDVLDRAINVLQKLSSGGGRMIGVISHVEALEQSLENQIVVRKDEGGSHLRVISERD